MINKEDNLFDICRDAKQEIGRGVTMDSIMAGILKVLLEINSKLDALEVKQETMITPEKSMEVIANENKVINMEETIVMNETPVVDLIKNKKADKNGK